MLDIRINIFAQFRIRTPRRFELSLPSRSQHLPGRIFWTPGRILWSLLHRSSDLLWMVPSQVRLPMDLHPRSQHLLRWCAHVLACGREAIIRWFLRSHVHCRIWSVDS